MKPRYLLDTNIMIYIRQKRPQPVLDRFQHLQVGEAVMSLVSYGELLYGAYKSQQKNRALTQLAELAALLPPQPLPVEASEAYGSIRADLERRGKVIGGNDLWIAAHALAAGLTLVTNNVREFSRVRGLHIENWISS